jgi:hypothetical protein
MRHHCFKYRIKVNMTWNLAKLPLRAQTPHEFIRVPCSLINYFDR